MRKTVFILLIFFSQLSFFSQNFTWIRGSNTAGLTGNYGTMGSPTSTADPGGRHGCATWTDASGNLWLFGGEGYSNSSTLCWLNDLWKYNPSTNQWTWVRGSNGPNAISVYGTQGVAANTNEPGAREFAMSWTDANGNFWLFGGDGFANNSTFGRLGDLWKYNPTTNQWTWMKGFNTIVQFGTYGTQGVANAANNPGCRFYGATWSDANNLYLFGGRGYGASGTASYLNDFWSYNLTTNNWTWISGSQNTLANGAYGTQGVASNTNIPGARAYSSAWTDASGNFYLFGGLGLGATGFQSYINDLWKYNSVSGTWTWLSGSNSTGASGVYGFLANGSTSVVPGARYAAASWSDPAGNLWLFGGQGFDSTNLVVVLNDLFKYEPAINKWTWMKGPKTGNNNGIYGTIGITSSSSLPGSRFYNTFWRDVHQTFWLLGGEGLDVSNSSYDHMNDLWGYRPPCQPDSISVLQGNQICSGNPVNLTAHAQFSSNINWFSVPGSSVPIASGSLLSVASLTTALTNTVYTYYASANNCTFAPLTAITITVKPLPVLSISGASIVCDGSVVTLTANGASTYTWTGPGFGSTKTYTPSTIQPFSITIVGTATNGCASNLRYGITVLALPTISVTATKTILISGETATLSATGALTYTWSNSLNTSTISVSPTLITSHFYSVTGTDQNGCKNSAQIKIFVLVSGLSENNQNTSNLFLYPNPNNGSFKIKNENGLENLQFKIFNNLGQLVFNKEVNKNTVEIKTSLPEGIYYYSLYNQENQSKGQIIIHN